MSNISKISARNKTTQPGSFFFFFYPPPFFSGHWSWFLGLFLFVLSYGGLPIVFIFIPIQLCVALIFRADDVLGKKTRGHI